MSDSKAETNLTKMAMMENLVFDGLLVDATN